MVGVVIRIFLAVSTRPSYTKKLLLLMNAGLFRQQTFTAPHNRGYRGGCDPLFDDCKANLFPTTIMAEKPKRSCKICHRRKIRCDGETPCRSCSRARKLFVCEYPPELSLGTTRVYLPKNLACVPCRQRKRRCDGKSPCSTCKETSQSDKCHRRQAVRRERESGLSHKTLVAIASRPLDTAATNSGISSLVFVAPTCVPRHIVLDTALSSLRSLFLDYSLQFCGINLTLAQREAIACGDTSGAIVPSIFIPLSQLMGHLLADVFTSERWAHLRGQTEKEAEHRLHILDRLNNSTPDALDPLTAVQVYQILALYWAKRRDFPRFLEFLGSASSIVDRHRVTLGLDDPAASDGPATNSPEGQSALAYLIFTEVAANNSMPFPPIVPPVLLLKFHQLFDRPQNKLDLNFVRAKGVLLLAESQRHLSRQAMDRAMPHPRECHTDPPARPEPGHRQALARTQAARLAPQKLHNHLTSSTRGAPCRPRTLPRSGPREAPQHHQRHREYHAYAHAGGLPLF
ncbi:hypothetical protein C8R46DRAFT_378509 [Mycena filopes]|nr:hypothetical protein C8R46DRAFT_378509 [Mycena filopes]